MNFIEPAVALAIGYPICVASTLWMFTKGTRWFQQRTKQKLDSEDVNHMIAASFFFPITIPVFLFAMTGEWLTSRNGKLSITQRLRNYINEGL